MAEGAVPPRLVEWQVWPVANILLLLELNHTTTEIELQADWPFQGGQRR